MCLHDHMWCGTGNYRKVFVMIWQRFTRSFKLHDKLSLVWTQHWDSTNCKVAVKQTRATKARNFYWFHFFISFSNGWYLITGTSWYQYRFLHSQNGPCCLTEHKSVHFPNILWLFAKNQNKIKKDKTLF